jgi:hypothetical protein
MTKPGHTYRVGPDQVIVSTNIRSRSDGMPYSNARGPRPISNTGTAVMFAVRQRLRLNGG